eukprot:Clim_evm14s7 gene=Clim_evmTU14s7
MGQVLSEPKTEKTTSRGEDKRVRYATSAMQGWRLQMEDAHATVLEHNGNEDVMFFGVYDGHGGDKVAKFAGEHLHEEMFDSEYFKRKEYEEMIKQGFLKLDEVMRKLPDFSRENSGSTAVVTVITDDTIYCGNAGDSRCVASVNGQAVPLSYDHKPMNQTEYQRICAAGGFVEFGRVNGNLALSRAIGDFEFKNNPAAKPEEQQVTAYPDVIHKTLDKDTEFLVLACDGIWDVMSNQEVVDFVRERIAKDTDLGQICEEMMDFCLAPESKLGGVGCDNMTVIVVAFLHGGEWQNVVQTCQKEAISDATS